MKRTFLSWTISICILQSSLAQVMHGLPEKGKPCPDFILHNIEYFSTRQAAISDFRGKWLVLDFWNKYCASCIQAFPGINEMHKQFGDKVQFMLVGIEDKEGEIRSKFKAIHEKMQLGLPCSMDSTLANKFDIYATPVTIIIDPDGKVRGVTGYYKKSDIADFVAGKDPALSYLVPTITYDEKKPLLIHGNGGNDTDFLFRSLLSRWNPAAPYYSGRGLEWKNGKFEVLRVDRNWLYKVAYLGDAAAGERGQPSHRKIWRFPVIEENDTVRYEGFPDGVLATGEGFYNYSLKVPVVNPGQKYLMKVLQQELENVFGYTVSLETRKIPCWKLVATDKARIRLRTKGAPNSYAKDLHHYTAVNVPVAELLMSPVGDYLPLIDATGIKGNIDITLDYGNSLNLIDGAMVAAYKANGLSFVKGEIEMKAFVLRKRKFAANSDTTLK